MGFKEVNYTVKFDDKNNSFLIIDQTLLPGRVEYRRLRKPEDFHEAIKNLRVRGAPAIGITAAFGLYLGVRDTNAKDAESFREEFIRTKNYLETSRPTAVNLFWALDRMEACLGECEKNNLDNAQKIHALKNEAQSICDEDAEVCRKIGENGLTLLKHGMGILTHCNAGLLATAKFGTALAPLHIGQERGYNFRVFADETRPLLQGARLTTFELMSSGVDVTLICDNMAATVMKNGWVDAVLVGCDRVAANGDTANKIGTLGVAIMAKHYEIPFYVCAPYSTLDYGTPTGRDISIEIRRDEEITEMWYKEKMAPDNVKVFNPAFDVTGASLITAFITEYGVIKPPFDISLQKLRDSVEGKQK